MVWLASQVLERGMMGQLVTRKSEEEVREERQSINVFVSYMNVYQRATSVRTI